MNAADVERIVRSELDGFAYEPSAPGSTLGMPWSEEKVRSYLPKLEAALVTPYQQTFAVRDTFEQIRAAVPLVEAYWVVAVTEYYTEFFDPAKSEFGLAEPLVPGKTPQTVVVGVFCAM